MIEKGLQGIPIPEPTPERKKEEEMNALRSEFLHNLDVLTRDGETVEVPDQGENDSDLERVAEFQLSSGREIIIYYRPHSPRNPQEEETIGGVVISEQRLGSKWRNISYEYKPGGILEKHETTASRAKGEALKKELHKIIKQAVAPVTDREAPLVTREELESLNRLLISLSKKAS